MSDADIVLEAVVEDIQVKNRLFKGTIRCHTCRSTSVITYCVNGILHHVSEFADIASLCPEEAVLYSNTLTLQLQDIFDNVHRPEVINFIAFFSKFGHDMVFFYNREQWVCGSSSQCT